MPRRHAGDVVFPRNREVQEKRNEFEIQTETYGTRIPIGFS